MQKKFENYLLEINKKKKKTNNDESNMESLNTRVVTLENLLLRKKHLYNQKLLKLEMEN